MKLNWTPEAKAQLKAIEIYIAQDSPIAAKRTVTRLVRRVQQAAEAPYSGHAVPEYQREDLRELLERPYRILYRITVEQVDIVTIWHYRRLLPSNLT